MVMLKRYAYIQKNVMKSLQTYLDQLVCVVFLHFAEGLLFCCIIKFVSFVSFIITISGNSW